MGEGLWSEGDKVVLVPGILGRWDGIGAAGESHGGPCLEVF